MWQTTKLNCVRCSIVILLLLCSLYIKATVAASFNKIVVFGDSLSDNGNLYSYMKHKVPKSPPYFNGRFSNGPVWAEHLAFNADVDLLDYAFGGAGVWDGTDEIIFTLQREVEVYLLSHFESANPKHLFIIWIGANNYLSLPDDPATKGSVVVSGIVASVTRLIDKGALQIAVFNLPDLGQTPAANMLGAADTLHQITLQHNALLEQSMQTLAMLHPKVKLLYIDVNSWMADATNNPTKYAFTNTTEPCLAATKASLSMLNIASDINQTTDIDCTGYLFFDALHPTTQTHQLFANMLAERLKVEDIHTG